MSDEAKTSETPPEILPAERKQAAPPSNDLVALSALYHRSGPLPDSREFAAYEKTLNGAADRILRMAEKQADHRMEMEKAVITGDIANEHNGLVAGATIVVATLGATCYLATVGLGAWALPPFFLKLPVLSLPCVTSLTKTLKNVNTKPKCSRSRTIRPK